MVSLRHSGRSWTDIYERPLPNLMMSSIAGNCPSFQKGVELVELTIDQPELVLMLMLLDELKVEPMELP